MNKNKNKMIVYITIILILLFVGYKSLVKIVDRTNSRKLEVTTKEIVEAAKECYYNESCVNNTITLEELYEKTELKDVVNPITKKLYNTSSYVNVENDFTFIEK